ncbi:hypothetical protein BU26DRAFT_311276 [Trematosphaeria pertusa]|uniref:Uncharacterized protein n=1 Tax=Trematosphaeria pertusa TaxID=390896 RepID=A0A6A6IFU7_9PLEO|nr:uncharacterized protein BU26DRAFT_311276 [Trematosphaeria pertusa]KAF2249057.1 hypothetical protein BU26DRAFT_311276 [Trematosphaeria pertusa]
MPNATRRPARLDADSHDQYGARPAAPACERCGAGTPVAARSKEERAPSGERRRAEGDGETSGISTAQRIASAAAVGCRPVVAEVSLVVGQSGGAVRCHLRARGRFSAVRWSGQPEKAHHRQQEQERGMLYTGFQCAHAAACTLPSIVAPRAGTPGVVPSLRRMVGVDGAPQPIARSPRRRSYQAAVWLGRNPDKHAHPPPKPHQTAIMAGRLTSHVPRRTRPRAGPLLKSNQSCPPPRCLHSTRPA